MTDNEYNDISTEIAWILSGALPDVVVICEEPIMIAVEMAPTIGVYHEGFEIPENGQPLAAGRQQRELLKFNISCWSYHLDIKELMRSRNALLLRARRALMKNRSLNDMVTSSWEVGAEMASSRVEDALGFVSGAELQFRVDFLNTTL